MFLLLSFMFLLLTFCCQISIVAYILKQKHSCREFYIIIIITINIHIHNLILNKSLLQQPQSRFRADEISKQPRSRADDMAVAMVIHLTG